MSIPAITLQPQIPDKPLSKQQKTFNSLVGKIRRARDRLQQWHLALQCASQAKALHIDPKARSLNALRKELLLALVDMQSDRRYNKTDRRRLQDMIVGLGHSCLVMESDAEIEAILDRLCTPEHEEYSSGMDDLFGFDDFFKADDPGVDGPEADTFDTGTDDRAGFQQRHPADFPHRQRNAQAPTLRAIYRKLASILHPDREPDPEESARKTVLLQRANAAYQQGDLLGLLGLQLEISLVDASHLSSMADAQIKDYVQALKAQLAGLESEIAQIEGELCASLPAGATVRKLDPGAIDTLIEYELESLGIVEAELKQVLSRKTEVRFMRSWLREQDRASHAMVEEEFEQMMAAFDVFIEQEVAPRRRRRR